MARIVERQGWQGDERCGRQVRSKTKRMIAARESAGQPAWFGSWYIQWDGAARDGLAGVEGQIARPDDHSDG